MPPFVERLQAEFLHQRNRWILWIPASLGLGVGGYFSLRTEPPQGVGLMALAFLLALLPFFYKSKSAVLAWLPFALIALGFTAAQTRTWIVTAPALIYKTHPVIVEGRVTSVEEMPQGFRFTVDHPQYPPNPRYPDDPVPEAVRITSKVHQSPPLVGDTVRVRAVLLPLSSPVEPGAYDFQRKAFFDGLGGTGYALGVTETLAHPQDDIFFFSALRHYIRTHIEARIPDKDAAAVTAGILIGESKAISDKAWDNIRLSGLAHLLAIAGLHTGTVTGWLFFLVRWILASIPSVALRYPVKKITAGMTIAGAIFYLYLVNFFLPAERAVIMACVVMTAIILDRDPFSPRLLAFAATLLLLLRPESLVGISFQMSFAAVSVLLAFYESTREWWSRLHQDRRWFMRLALLVLGSMATTGAATLGTAPYSLFHFLRVPLISGFFANLLAVPIVVVITLPVGIISCLLMPLGLDALPLKIVGWSVTAILKIAEATAHWPYAAYHTNSWPMSVLLLITFGGLWTCIWRGRMRWLGLVPVLAGIILIPLAPRADMLVAANGKLFAVRDDKGGLLLSPGRADKFTREAWVEREGGDESVDWPVESDLPGNTYLLYKTKNHVISFIEDKAALARDCGTADIVISPLYIDPALCPAAHMIIDRQRLKKTGAQALYFNEDGTIAIRTVAATRGVRPWTGIRY